MKKENKSDVTQNGHYEIRTLDQFTIYKNSAEEMELLADPDGYQIIKAKE